MRISLKIFSKKVIFCFLGLILISAIAGFFYYWQIYKTPPEKWAEAKYSPAEDYKITEENGEKFIENKKAGISFKVPNGWRIEKPQGRDYVALLSPEAKNTLFLENGCKIIIETRYIKTDIETIEKELRRAHKSWGKVDEYEKINFSGKETLKNKVEIESADQFGTGLHIPKIGFLKNKTIYAGLSSHRKDKDVCWKNFQNFLSTVSIE